MYLRPSSVDVVIARDREHTERRAQAGERTGEVRDVLAVVVDLVAGDDQEVRRRSRHRLRDSREKSGRRMRTDMQIGDLDNAESDQPFRQVREARLERLDAQQSRADIADDRPDDVQAADDNEDPARGDKADPER